MASHELGKGRPVLQPGNGDQRFGAADHTCRDFAGTAETVVTRGAMFWNH